MILSKWSSIVSENFLLHASHSSRQIIVLFPSASGIACEILLNVVSEESFSQNLHLLFSFLPIL